MTEQHPSYLTTQYLAGRWVYKSYCRWRAPPPTYLQGSMYMVYFNCWIKHCSLQTDISSGAKGDIVTASTFPLPFFAIGTLEICKGKQHLGRTVFLWEDDWKRQ